MIPLLESYYFIKICNSLSLTLPIQHIHHKYPLTDRCAHFNVLYILLIDLLVNPIINYFYLEISLCIFIF